MWKSDFPRGWETFPLTMGSWALAFPLVLFRSDSFCLLRPMKTVHTTSLVTFPVRGSKYDLPRL